MQTTLLRSTNWVSCLDARQVQRGGGALQARVGDPRKSARCEPSRRGPDPQQPGHRVSSPGQVQRGGGALQACVGRSARKRLVRTTRTWAETLNNLANVYRAQGKYSEAEGLYKRALAIREKALGANHPDVGQSHQQPGASCIKPRASTPRLRGCYKRALAIQRASARCEPPRRGPDPQQPGQRVSSPGQVQRGGGAATSARWRSARKALGANHPDVGQSFNNLRLVYRAQGKYSEAEGLFKRALVIREKGARCEATPTWPDPQ